MEKKEIFLKKETQKLLSEKLERIFTKSEVRNLINGKIIEKEFKPYPEIEIYRAFALSVLEDLKDNTFNLCLMECYLNKKDKRKTTPEKTTLVKGTIEEFFDLTEEL